MELGRGFEVSQCIFVAAQLNLPDLLAEEQKTCHELAAATQTDSDMLRRLLAVLTNLNIVIEIFLGQFALAKMGQLLRSDVSNSLRDFMLMRAEQDYTIWSSLLDSLRSGKGVFENSFGMSRYDYFKQHPEARKSFDRAMKALSQQHLAAIVSAYDFSGVNTLADIGGGEGVLLETLMNHYPNLQGILFERQEETLETARSAMAANLEARCQFIKGDFFAGVPDGADTYVLKHVLHNWDDTQAGRVLNNFRQAMKKNDRLLIIEPILNTHERSLKLSLLALRMLVSMPEGNKRTETEFKELLQTTGFTITRIIPTQLELKIIEAITSRND